MAMVTWNGMAENGTEEIISDGTEWHHSEHARGDGMGTWALRVIQRPLASLDILEFMIVAEASDSWWWNYTCQAH
eukprot:705420-Amphidinium_carterae.1